MNEPRYEVFPEENHERDLPGEFVWHFRDGNGKLTHNGGESFTRREDAHRSIRGVGADVALQMGFNREQAEALASELTVVDLDENDDVIATS